jgi:filamentous hemagglutinin family protein
MVQDRDCLIQRGIGLVTIGSLLWGIVPTATLAQITSDGSLGTLVNGSANISCTGRCNITQGTTRGNNLFHSFRQFSLPDGNVAGFNTAPTIRNVFVRVTGVGTPFISNINGTIATRNPANFFLLNPNGIIFGPNAALNIGGAFLATTANRMQFADGAEFRLDTPDRLLTISAPIGLQLGQMPGAIQMQSAVLAADGQDRFSDFALVGGAVTLTDAAIQTPGRKISLIGVGENGGVGLQLQGDRLNLSLPPDTPRQDITVTNDTALNVFAPRGGGGVELMGRNISVNQSFIRSGIAAGAGNATTNRAGDIILNASNDVQISDSFITNNVRNRVAVGNAGDLVITGANLLVTERSELQSLTQGRGNAGNILIDVRDRILFDRSPASTGVQSGAIGNGGMIRVNAGTLTFTKTARLTASTSGQGSAGSITVAVRDRATFDDAYLSGVVNRSGIGDGGDLNVSAGTLFLINGGQLVAGTSGRGNAGNILVNVRDQIIADTYDPGGEFPSGILSRVEVTGIGKGGDIQVFTGSLSVSRGAQILADVVGRGNAGDIQLFARDLISVDGLDAKTGNVSIVLASVESANGQSGNIVLEAPTIQITNVGQVNALTTSSQKGGDIFIRANDLGIFGGGQVTTTTFFRGQAGNIKLDVRDRILLSGENSASIDRFRIVVREGQRFRLNVREGKGESGLFASTRPGSTGNGGNIVIDPKGLIVQDGAKISVESQGSGEGGIVRIQADQLHLKNRGQISASTTSNQGGNIFLNLRDLLLLRNGSLISASAGTAQAGGNGGNITISVPQGLILGIPRENSDITANAYTGNGGKVDISTQSILGLQRRSALTPLSDITASSESGLAGSVTITTPDVDPSRGLSPLPLLVNDPTTKIDRQCSVGSRITNSQFVVKGQGGLPSRPEDYAQATMLKARLVTMPAQQSTVSDRPAQAIASAFVDRSAPHQSSITEAQNAIRLANGQIRFTASSPDSQLFSMPHCHE